MLQLVRFQAEVADIHLVVVFVCITDSTPCTQAIRGASRAIRHTLLPCAYFTARGGAYEAGVGPREYAGPISSFMRLFGKGQQEYVHGVLIIYGR